MISASIGFICEDEGLMCFVFAQGVTVNNMYLIICFLLVSSR